jgi:hypothetical protein
MAGKQVNFRLEPDLIEAARDWSNDAGITLTQLVEDSLRERLGRSPESTDYRLEDHERRIAEIERLAKREGALS